MVAGIRSTSSAPSASETYTVQPAVFEEWIPLSGRLEAADPLTFRAELDGLSKLTFLAEDGTPVLTDEVIARFDHSDLEERQRTLIRDRDIARASFTSLRDAEHPLELQRLQQEILALEGEIQREDFLRKETSALVEEDLLSLDELEVHDQNLAALTSRKEALENQLDLTRRILHPTALEIARARLTAAEEGLTRVQEDLASTVVKAPRDGSVNLPLIPIDSERRPARVGDGLYRNQVYLQLSDLTDLVIRAEVGERLLAKVMPGMEARVEFPAFPQRSARARVASVGAYPGGTRRQYPVELHWIDPPPDLRPGLSATLHILSSRLEEALVVPREFLDWQSGEPTVRTRQGTLRVETGPGNAREIVISSGLEPGTVLVSP